MPVLPTLGGGSAAKYAVSDRSNYMADRGERAANAVGSYHAHIGSPLPKQPPNILQLPQSFSSGFVDKGRVMHYENTSMGAATAAKERILRQEAKAKQR
jgi:hypothetical protein